MSGDPDPPFLASQKVQALAGLAAAVRGVNGAAQFYAQVFGYWPRFDESIARILTTPLDSLEVQQQLNVAVLGSVVPGHE